MIGIWLLLLLGALTATTAAKPFQTDFELPESEAQRAVALLDEKFPGQSEMDLVAQAKVVVQAPAGTTLDRPENVARVDALVEKLRGLAHVRPQTIANPLTTPPPAGQVGVDRTIAHLDVVYDQKFVDIEEQQQVQEFKQVLQEARDSGLTVEATGTLLSGQPPPRGLSEALGFGVALLVMIIAFASVVAATLPIITGLFGVGISVSLITGATAFVDMDSTSLLLASMIGIAVSIDYSLFIVSRYRTELNHSDDRALAAGRAVGTAGSSVVFAGLTVIIALVGLAVTGIPMMAVMGFTAAVAVTVAGCVAVTLLPAVLGLFGDRAFSVHVPGLRRGNEPESAPSNGMRWARLVAAHPIPAALAAAIALIVIAVPVTKLELGFDLAPGDQKKAVELIGRGVGEGLTGPLIVVADGDNVSDRQAAYTRLVETIRGMDDVVMVAPPQLNTDGSGALITVIPESAPSSPQTPALVDQIRALQPRFAEPVGLDFGVTGQTAIVSDLSEALMKALVPYLTVVVGLAFVVLMLVFRSVLVPVTAALGFLLSIAATFGATVAVFQEGWFGLVKDPAPIISFLPIFLIGIVFGLAMDYQVFLVTRMREEYVMGDQNRAGAQSAVITGFSHGARVVTSAAVIMISVFSAFMLMPETVAKSMGFAMSAAVLFDAFLVRMTIIPAVMSLLGAKAWWLPSWLDRLLPDVDVEGKKMRENIAADLSRPPAPHPA